MKDLIKSIKSLEDAGVILDECVLITDGDVLPPKTQYLIMRKRDLDANSQ